LARSAAVSPKEVAAALAKAKPGTVDHVVLSLLAEYHPVVDSKPAPQE
jgi:acyl-CoA synthetase (NDP forming)